MTTLIEARGLLKHFGTTTAVEALDLRVEAGEAYGLVGPDGAGKTTAMRLLVGALKLDAGSVSIGGHNLRHQAEAARAMVGYLAQRFSLYTDLTVYENLRFFGEMRGVRGPAFESRATELLDFVGLSGFETRQAGNLSGGMKQKLGLATALVHRPKVLLLDEPTAGLSPRAMDEIFACIRAINAQGVGILMVEQNARQALGLAHRGYVLATGENRYTDTGAALLANREVAESFLGGGVR